MRRGAALLTAPPEFVFNIKAYRLFTRDQTPVASLAKEVRAALDPVTKANMYDEDVPAEIQLELWRQFRAMLETNGEVVAFCSTYSGSDAPIRQYRRRIRFLNVKPLLTTGCSITRNRAPTSIEFLNQGDSMRQHQI